LRGYLLFGLLMLFASLAFGFMVASKVRIFESFVARLCFAIPFGIACFSFLELAMYATFGRVSTISIIAASLTLTVLSAAIYLSEDVKARRNLIGKKIVELPIPVLAATAIIIVVISAIFLYSFSESNGTVICIDAGCGDISYHIGIGNSLIYSSFPPKYPFTVGTTNVYPFIADFFSAMLLKEGMGLVPSIMVPDLLLIFSMVCLSAMLIYKLLKNSLASVCSMLI
jgi:hypothetical protein